MFEDVPLEALRELCSRAPEVRFGARALLMKQGDVAQDALLLVDGRLRMYVQAGDTARALASVRPGEVFGEEGLYLRGAERAVTVMASVDSTCLLLSPDLLDSLAQNHAVVAVEQHLLRAQSRRIRRSTDKIRKAWDKAKRIQERAQRGPSLKERLGGWFRKGRS